VFVRSRSAIAPSMRMKSSRLMPSPVGMIVVGIAQPASW
jgi:hypothetical protein